MGKRSMRSIMQDVRLILEGRLLSTTQEMLTFFTEHKMSPIEFVTLFEAWDRKYAFCPLLLPRQPKYVKEGVKKMAQIVKNIPTRERLTPKAKYVVDDVQRKFMNELLDRVANKH